jgi:hypothetical protein
MALFTKANIERDEDGHAVLPVPEEIEREILEWQGPHVRDDIDRGRIVYKSVLGESEFAELASYYDLPAHLVEWVSYFHVC